MALSTVICFSLGSSLSPPVGGEFEIHWPRTLMLGGGLVLSLVVLFLVLRFFRRIGKNRRSHILNLPDISSSPWDGTGDPPLLPVSGGSGISDAEVTRALRNLAYGDHCIQSRVRDIIREFFEDPPRFNRYPSLPLTCRFRSDLGLDSLDAVQMIMEFEQTFDIVIPDEDVVGITTIGDAVYYLEHKLNRGL